MRFHTLPTIGYFLLQAHLGIFVVCISQGNIQELLDVHNRYRTVVSSEQLAYTVANMNQLEWSDRLSNIASGLISCHSTRPRQLQQARSVFGHVNVGRGRQSVANLSRIVEQWFEEKANYLSEENECFPWDGCKNYKTMINARHSQIGCATIKWCGHHMNTEVLMCLYEGGQAEEFQFQLGPPCTGCSHPMGFCRSSLCVSCNGSSEECDCRKSCNKAGIGAGQLDSTNCSCTCFYGDGPNCDQPCQNRQMYIDFDVCTLVSPSDCNDASMGEHYRRFCAEVCSCRRPPVNVTSTDLEM